MAFFITLLIFIYRIRWAPLQSSIKYSPKRQSSSIDDDDEDTQKRAKSTKFLMMPLQCIIQCKQLCADNSYEMIVLYHASLFFVGVCMQYTEQRCLDLLVDFIPSSLFRCRTPYVLMSHLHSCRSLLVFIGNIFITFNKTEYYPDYGLHR